MAIKEDLIGLGSAAAAKRDEYKAEAERKKAEMEEMHGKAKKFRCVRITTIVGNEI